MANLKIAPGGSASVHVLHEGYVGRGGDSERVAGTVTLIIDGDAVIVVDPGHGGLPAGAAGCARGARPAGRGRHRRGIQPSPPRPHGQRRAIPRGTHSRPLGRLPGDRWVDRDAHGAGLSASVRLLRTPGHTAEDISTVASTPGDVVACTHAWWAADGPADDPLGTDLAALHASRELLLSVASMIVPGHGAAFRPDHRTPR